MTKTRLTDLSIRRLPHPETGQARYWDELTPGFGVSVSQRSKSFIVVYGKDRRLMVLGRYPSLSLSEARTEAKPVQSHIPSKRRLDRLIKAVSEYCEHCEDRVRPNTLKEYRRHLIKAPDIALADLTKKDVDLRKPHAVNAWKVFMNWCIRNEFADRNPFMHIPVKYGKRERVLSVRWSSSESPSLDGESPDDPLA